MSTGDEHKFSSSWKDFAMRTTVNGAALIIQEARLKTRWRIFSVLFMVIIITAFALGTKALFVYLTYSTEIRVTLRPDNGDVKFPGITLCNTNHAKRTSIFEDPVLLELLSFLYVGTLNDKDFVKKVLSILFRNLVGSFSSSQILKYVNFQSAKSCKSPTGRRRYGGSVHNIVTPTFTEYIEGTYIKKLAQILQGTFCFPRRLVEWSPVRLRKHDIHDVQRPWLLFYHKYRKQDGQCFVL